MKSKIILVCILLLVFSCQTDDSLLISPEEIDSSNLDVINQVPTGEVMILGKKLQNPYSIENLNKAREIINEQRAKNKRLKNFAEPAYKSNLEAMPVLAATHLYVKFKPTTEQHCKDLLDIDEAGSMTLHAYPIDSEIIQEGTTPLADGIVDAGLNELYAVIPIEDPIPNIPYQILDRIIPEPDDELLEDVSFFITDNQDELESDMTLEKIFERDAELKKTKNKDTKHLNKFGRSKWWPQGNILIHDTEQNRDIALRQVKVSIGRWFKWRQVHTDNNGKFVSDRSFRNKKVRVRTKWKSNIATIRKSWNEILGIAVSDHAMTVWKSSNGPTKTIGTNEEHLWYKGTVHNGLVKVNDFFAEKGMSGRIHKANIWVTPSSNHRAAALMLKKYTWTVSTKALFTSWWTWIGAKYLFPINVVFSHLYPDITLSLGRGTDTKAIEQLLFHECGHYMHALNTGGSYWGDVVQAEANNILNGRGPYGNGQQPNNSKGELIALAEGWATFIEHRMMEELYGSPFIFADIENYTMFTRPNSQNESDDQHWFLTGLFWDLYDVNLTAPDIGDVVRLRSGDNGGFISNNSEELEGDYQALYDLMDRNTRRANDLENRIINAYPQIEQRTINTFNAYGY